MTPSDRPGDVRMLQRPESQPPPYGGYAEYGGHASPEPTTAMAAMPTMIEERPQRRPQPQPQPIVSLLEPRVVAAVAGIALLVGFALASLLFGVLLNDDGSESIGASGDTPTVDDAASDALGLQGGDAANPATPLNADTDPLGAQAEDQSAMADPEAMEEGVDSTLAVESTTPPPTTAATTATTAPSTAATAATTTPTTAATTAAPTTAATGSTEAPASTVAPPANPPAAGDAVFQQQVLDLTNAERATAGCAAVVLDPTLNSVADAHSEDMAANSYFDHTGLDGSQPWDRVAAAGYPARGSGENIAQGYSSAADVVAGWMASPGHRRNMLDCQWTELGVGYAEGAGGGNIRPLYWTQVFAIRR